MQRTADKWQISSPFVPILIGLFAFAAICGFGILNPSHVAWISPGDPTQHYLGWEFYRHSSTSLPLGLNPNFGLDIASSIVYSDSIPIIAILLKPFSRYLSEPFQYLGLWYLVCFLLQAWFSWLLVGLIVKDFYIKSISVALFTTAPAFLCLLGITAALASHFLILSALYLTFRQSQERRSLWWALLICSAVGIHFYLFVMVIGVWFADLLDKAFIQKIVSRIKAGKEIGIVLLFATLVAWQCGYFMASGGSLSAEGYGDISNKLNPLAIFFDRQWSYLLNYAPQIISWRASNNFLGLGLIALLLVVAFNSKNSYIRIKRIVLQNIFLILLLFGYFLFAITNNVDIGTFHFSYELPDWVLATANILRGSTRLFWPNYYLLIFLLIYCLASNFNRRFSYLILIVITCIQFIDTGNGWLYLREKMKHSYGPQDAPLISAQWGVFSKRYSKIILAPENPLRIQFETFATYSAVNKLATNSVLLARPDLSKVALANQKFDLAMSSGQYDPHALYIIDDDLVIPVSKTLNRKQDLFARIDGFNVLAPGWLECDSCPIVSPDLLIHPPELPLPKLDASIAFGKGGSGAPYLLGIGQFERVGWGWAYPESWGVWSEGREGKLLIPYPKDTKPTSAIFIAKALIGSKHPFQRVEIWVNGQIQKTVTLNKFDANVIEIALPKETARNFCLIEFRFPDAVSAQELGMGDDLRKLAIGLESGVLK